METLTLVRLAFVAALLLLGAVALGISYVATRLTEHRARASRAPHPVTTPRPALAREATAR